MDISLNGGGIIEDECSSSSTLNSVDAIARGGGGDESVKGDADIQGTSSQSYLSQFSPSRIPTYLSNASSSTP